MNFLNKWYLYQKERFPIIIYGLYVFCIVFAVFCFCNFYGNNLSIINATSYKIEWIKIVPMFIVAFLQFLMVRIVDEFKDYKEDCMYRPYRPVPRGLIKLSELRTLFMICIIMQVVLTITVNTKGIIFLFLLWAYFALMRKDFFLGKIIDKHILFGVLLDEVLMPILVLYLASYIKIDISLWKLLLMSYIISWIVEVARKLRCKEDEEKGVKTYTSVLGIKKAVLLLWGLEAILTIINILILQKILFLIIAFIFISLIDLIFMIKQNKIFAKVTELSANIYIMIAYLSMLILIL